MGNMVHEVFHEAPPYTAYDRDGRRKYTTRAEGKRFLKEARRLPTNRALFCMTIYFTEIRVSEALAITR